MKKGLNLNLLFFNKEWESFYNHRDEENVQVNEKNLLGGFTGSELFYLSAKVSKEECGGICEADNKEGPQWSTLNNKKWINLLIP